MKQFEDPTDYTFRTPNGNETTFSAYDLDTALCQAPPDSELIRVNDDPRFQGVFYWKKCGPNTVDKVAHIFPKVPQRVCIMIISNEF